MERQKSLHFAFIFLIICTFFLQNIPKTESALKCAPDFISKGDNY